MLNVKFETQVRGDGEDIHYVIVNEVADLASNCFQGYDKEWHVFLKSLEVFNMLASYQATDVANFMGAFSRSAESGNGKFKFSIDIKCKGTVREPPRIDIFFDFDVELWDKPYSIFKLSEIFKGLVKGQNNPNLTYVVSNDMISNGFGISMPIQYEGQIIKDAAERSLSIFIDLQTSAEATAIDTLDKENLITFFSFPEEFKVACKQYLVYFAQFLLDLGIEAEMEIKEEGGQTLFKVIPKDKHEALANIKEALDTFLDAASNTDLQVQEQFTVQDVAVMQWQANVMHLRSQVMFLESAVQLKDATIASLKLTNYQYEQLAIEYGAKGQESQEEDIIPGVLAVTKIKSKGISINLPEILRRLKRRIYGK